MNFGFIFHMRYIFVTHFLSAKYVKNDLRKLSIVVCGELLYIHKSLALLALNYSHPRRDSKTHDTLQRLYRASFCIIQRSLKMWIWAIMLFGEVRRQGEL